MKKGNWYLSAILAILMSCLAVTAQAQSELNALLAPYLSRHDMPALAAAVVQNGKIVASGAIGTRRAGQSIPVTINDRFHIGSDTKAMTALLVAMLVEEKKLTWESTLGELFPELAGKMDRTLRSVTVKQLLSHTSGIPADNEEFMTVLATSIQQPGNLDELRYWLLEQWCVKPLVSAPGSQFTYANMNYVIAGVIIERLAKKTWEELLVERIFSPLGMDTAGIGPQSSPGRVDAPLSHQYIDGKLKPLLAGPNADGPAIIGPAGLAHMSILDFARWASWNAGGGKRGPALVSPDTLRRLHTPVVAMPERKNPPPGTPPGGKYALGWGELTMPWAPDPLIYHGGSNTMNLAHIWIDPKRDFAMVVTTNVSTPKTAEILNEIARELYTRFAPKN